MLTKKCQTVSVLGIDFADVRKLVVEKGVRGVDRVVSIGQTLTLDFVWDGFRMIDSMSRIVYIGA